MMRHHSSLALGLAMVAVLPTAAPGGQEPADLEGRLEATVAALEHLAGVERRLQAGDDSVLPELLQSTEPPITDAEQRDERLALLRVEVAGLHERWDELGAVPLGPAPGNAPLPRPTDGATKAGASPNLPPSHTGPSHTGLTPVDRAAIERSLEVADAPRDREPVTSDGDGSGLRDYVEDEGYSADSLRQGRLLARAERWDEALELLRRHEDDPEARFWMARCHEGRGRLGEAIDLLDELVAAGTPSEEEGAPPPSPEARALARRASHDLKFLQLRRQLEGTEDAEVDG